MEDNKILTKRCTKCGEEKEMTEFGKNKNNKQDGRSAQCKKCKYEHDSFKRNPNIKRRRSNICEDGFKICSKCKVKKPISEFENRLDSKDGTRSSCRECRREKYQLDHPGAKPIGPYNQHGDTHDGMKFCTKCKREFPTYNFGKSSISRDGFAYWCKNCKREHEYNKSKNHLKQYDDSPGMKVCRKCGVKKPTSEFYEDLKHTDKLCSRCKECGKTYYRERSKTIEFKKWKFDYRVLYDSRPETKLHRKEYMRIWKKTPKGRFSWVRGDHNRKSLQRKSKCTLTLKQWNKILKMQNNKCAICGREFGENLKPTRDHIIPLSNPACPGLTFGNTQALCQSCNSSKNNKFKLGNAIDNILVKDI